jgi:transposase
METVGKRKRPRARRSFTPEFKAEIVELCQRGDRSVGQVARDFDLTETAVREWVRQADVDAGSRPGLTSAEREELNQLRRESRRLQQDVEILRRATAFFAFVSPRSASLAVEMTPDSRLTSLKLIIGNATTGGLPRSPP